MSANDIQVFRADEEDAEGVAAVHAKAFDAAYRESFPEVVAKAPELEERVESWTELLGGDGESAYTLVAEQRGTAVGFCAVAAPSRDADTDEKTAEIAALYVAPSRWGNGIGTSLLKQAFEELAEGVWEEVTVWVLNENDPGRRFYARFGFEPDGLAGPDTMTGRPKIRLRAPIKR